MAWIEIWTALLVGLAPAEDVLSQRVALLAELRAATENECKGHDDLIDRYDAAVEAAADDGGVHRLRMGRLQAYALRRAQTGRIDDDDWMWREAAALEELELATETVAELQSVRSALEEPPRGVCTEPSAPAPRPAEVVDSPEPEVSPEGPRPKPEESTPASTPNPSTPPPRAPARWERRELAFVLSGAGVGIAGVGGVVAGVSGPFLARARIDGDPTPAQQEFLDESVPRRSAVWTSVGAAFIGAGTTLLVTGLVQRRCRRTDRC